MTRDTPTSVDLEDLWGVYAVPPLPRKADSRRSLDLDAAERVARHIADGGITRFLYGGNAFLYHISLAEYETLLDWLAGFRGAAVADPEPRSFIRTGARSGLPASSSRLPHGDDAAVRRSA